MTRLRSSLFPGHRLVRYAPVTDNTYDKERRARRSLMTFRKIHLFFFDFALCGLHLQLPVMLQNTEKVGKLANFDPYPHSLRYRRKHRPVCGCSTGAFDVVTKNDFLQKHKN